MLPLLRSRPLQAGGANHFHERGKFNLRPGIHGFAMAIGNKYLTLEVSLTNFLSLLSVLISAQLFQDYFPRVLVH